MPSLRPNPSAALRRAIPTLRFLRVAVVALGFLSALGAAEAAKRSFNVPADDASAALKRFSEQAGLEVVFPSELARGIRTQAVKGTMTAPEALDAMLAGTGLRAVRDEQSGAFTLSRVSVPNAERAAPSPAPATARPNDLPASHSEEPVVLSPFTVDSSRDSGYLARRAVSVSGLNTPVQDLAQSIEIFTQEFMADVGAVSIADVLMYSASVGVSSHDLDGIAKQVIRGAGNDFILRNGFRADRIAADTVNIERTEVVKGASAILYGQTVMGGVVNYVTKEPRMKRHTSIGASYGSWESARATFDTTGPLLRDRILYRLVASWQEAGQWIDWGYDDSRFISPKLAFLPCSGLRFDVSYEDFRRDTFFNGSIHFDAANNNRPFDPPLPIDFDVFGPQGYNRQRNQLWEGQMRWQVLENTSFRLLANYRESSLDRNFRGTQGGITEITGRRRTGGNPGTTAANLAVNQGRINRNLTDRHVSNYRAESVTNLNTRLGATKIFYGAEFDKLGNQYRAQAMNPFFGLAGHAYSGGQLGLPAPAVYFDSFRQFVTSDPGYVAAMTALNTTTQFSRDITGLADQVWGYYGTIHHTIPNEKLILSAGTRWDDGNRDHFVPQFGAVYKIRSWLSAYALYSRSWLYQATSNLPLPDGSLAGYRGPLPPSKGLTKEIGFKLDLGKAYVTAAAFDMENNGKVGSAGNPNYDANLPVTNINSNRNVATLRGGDYSRGWELSAVLQPWKEWQTTVGYTRLHAADIPINPGDVEVQPTGAPNDSISLWSRYDFRSGWLKNFGLGGGIRYVGRRHIGGQGDYYDPARAIYEASAFYRTKVFGRDTRLQLNVKNLEDELYFWLAGRYSPPINWRLSVNTSF